MDYENLDKIFVPQRISLRQILLLFLFATTLNTVLCFGFDSANSCSPNGKVARRGRAQMLAAIPCDLSRQAYCNLPGSAYPWHAVRRFVHENQGLMKRMYGDVRHISILRDEIQNNEIDIEDVEIAAERYSRDGHRSRSPKYMHNTEYGNLKNNEVLMEPHFRPVATTTNLPTQTTTGNAKTTKRPSIETTTKSNLTKTKTTELTEPMDKRNQSKNTTKTELNKKTTTSTNSTTANIEHYVEDDDGKIMMQNVAAAIADDSSSEDEDENLAINSIYETPPTSPQVETYTGDNIEIVNSPQLGSLHNLTEIAATISTTLKVITTTTTAKAKTNDEKIATSSGNNSVRKSTIYQQQQQQQQQQQEQQQKQQQFNIQNQQLQKATSTKLKESSNIKPNESERIPVTSSPVKGTTTATSLLKSHNNNHNNNNNKKPDYSNAPTEPTTATASFLSSSSSSSSSKSSIDLLSGEKLRKPTNSPATATAASATKPVLRDGQLFQDTLKQETPPVVNARGVNACPVKEEVVAPFWANNTRGEVLALLNLYPFEQYVHWEKCTHEHKQMYCREGCRCEQQYRLHRLLAYDPHNECRGIFSDWFRFPSCCICKCYDIPMDFRATSRSPRSDRKSEYTHSIKNAEEEVQRAIYDHATEEWYRPKDDLNIFEG